MKHDDLLDEPSDKFFVEVRDVGSLLADEVLQLFDPVHGLFPAVAVHFGLLFLLPEPEDLVGDDNGSGDVFLQGFQESVFISENLVECLDDDILQNGFVYCPVGAVHVGGGWLQAADAAPDN